MVPGDQLRVCYSSQWVVVLDPGRWRWRDEAKSIQALLSHWIRERKCARKKWVLEKQGKHPITWDLVL